MTQELMRAKKARRPAKEIGPPTGGRNVQRHRASAQDFRDQWVRGRLVGEECPLVHDDLRPRVSTKGHRMAVVR
jgi:hypothetical protein